MGSGIRLPGFGYKFKVWLNYIQLQSINLGNFLKLIMPIGHTERRDDTMIKSMNFRAGIQGSKPGSATSKSLFNNLFVP